MKRLSEKKKKGTVLRINFKHHKDDTNKKGIRKIYLGDYKKLFDFLNKDSIFYDAYYEHDLKVYADHMILTLNHELDAEHEEYIKNKLKNTTQIDVVEIEV